MSEIRIGCSGWSYEAWEGVFYNKGERNKLSFYSRFFNTVEVDSTFYSIPEKQTVESWYKNTPQDFKFSLKIPKLVTHEDKLSASSLVHLRKFLETIEPLKSKLALLIIQLPPYFTRERYQERFETFVSSLDNSYRWAVEFRSLDWLSDRTFSFLERREIAYTVVDEPLLPSDVHITAPFCLIRFHGRGRSIWYNYLYSEEEIDEWSDKIKEVSKKCKSVYSYFNNHYRGFAALNALQLIKKLGKANKEHEEMLDKMIKSLKMDYKGLLSYVEQKGSIDKLKQFSTDSRVERALSIEDKDIKIDELSKDRLRGWVSGYYIDIDLKNKTIKHECQDWINNVNEGKLLLCKHILAFFRSLPQELIDSFAEALSKREEWKLEARISF